MLRTIVKISNITNLSDARYCAGMGVEYLGFSMDALPHERFAEMRGWVAGVQIVGETSSPDPAHVAQLIQTYLPDSLQVSEPAVIPALKMQGLPIILRIDFAKTDIADLEALFTAYQTDVAYFLLDSSDPFAHLEADTLAIIDRFAFRFPILLGFGLRVSNVKDILDELPLGGIALQGGDELRPGFKDFGEMMDILEAIEED